VHDGGFLGVVRACANTVAIATFVLFASPDTRLQPILGLAGGRRGFCYTLRRKAGIDAVLAPHLRGGETEYSRLRPCSISIARAAADIHQHKGVFHA